jgi:hypothetical protein
MTSFGMLELRANDPGVDVLLARVGNQVHGKVHTSVLVGDPLVPVGVIARQEKIQLPPSEGTISWGWNGSRRRRSSGSWRWGDSIRWQSNC